MWDIWLVRKQLKWRLGFLCSRGEIEARRSRYESRVCHIVSGQSPENIWWNEAQCRSEPSKHTLSMRSQEKIWQNEILCICDTCCTQICRFTFQVVVTFKMLGCTSCLAPFLFCRNGFHSYQFRKRLRLPIYKSSKTAGEARRSHLYLSLTQDSYTWMRVLLRMVGSGGSHDVVEPASVQAVFNVASSF